MRDLSAAAVARVLGFVGYGNLAAPLWFIGLEEGLGAMADADVRANLFSRGRFDETMDLAQAHMTLVENGRPYDISRRDRFSPVWLWMARFARAIGGADDWRDLASARAYIRARLGRSDGATFMTYASPVPEKGLHTRQWTELVRQTGVDVTRHQAQRAARIRTLIEQHRPAIVICHGLTAQHAYQGLLPALAWQQVPGAPSVLAAQDAEGRLRFVTPFFGNGQMGFDLAESLVRAIIGHKPVASRFARADDVAAPAVRATGIGVRPASATSAASQRSQEARAMNQTPDEFRDNTDPKITVRLLDLLRKKGLGDDAFWRLHHKRAINHHETIQEFRSYCTGLRGRFRTDSTNSRVHDRLLHALSAHRAEIERGGPQTDFVTLAERAWKIIPHR
ncbi:hypothetical protein DFR50_1124 [Roseiarcus fermentans]|uniref:Uncharacterized protein n=1 Tax=Roseiarcus fermentans TaxID=1473586 RepID=A0A366FFZ5_9HYPH|nr:hypothetical protein [Roseiarcus fermentans]RBP13036.1 hypothetical protein DFR50_1124 [Roseiarcus fermentans]